MNRALLVGINAYPSAPLSGCINDVQDMAQFLVSKCGFAAADVRLVTDARATTAGILERLRWLTTGLRKGDRVLFHYSGHGAQVPTRSPSGELDGLDEVICPVDFDWSDTRMIRDKDFARIFAAIPAGVEFIWVSDSCHSGDLTRDFPKPKQTDRRYPVPADIQWRQKVWQEAHDAEKGKASKGIKSKGPASALSVSVFQGFSTSMLALLQQLNVALISGCQSDQTSADAWFNNRANGALTYFLLKELNKADGLKTPLTDLVPRIVSALKTGKFSQVPQLEGSKAIMGRAFMVV